MRNQCRDDEANFFLIAWHEDVGSWSADDDEDEKLSDEDYTHEYICIYHPQT